MRRTAALALAASLVACAPTPAVPRSPSPSVRGRSSAAGSLAVSPVATPNVPTTTIRVGGSPWGTAYGFDAVWTPVGDAVIEVNVLTDEIESTVPLARSITSGRTTPGDPNAYDTAAIGVTGVWVTLPRKRLTVVHIDPKYQRVIAVIPIGRGPGRPVPIAVGPDAVWVPSAADGDLVRIDPRTDAIVDRFAMPKGVEPAGIALAGDGVWLSDAASSALLAFDASTGRISGRVRVGAGGALATNDVVVWSASGEAGRVVGVDGVDGSVRDRAPLCGGDADVALGDGLFWATGPDGLCVADARGASAPVRIDLEGAGPVTAYDRSAWVAIPDAGWVVRVDLR